MIFTIRGIDRPGGEMKIGVACDHAGFLQKETILDTIVQNGHNPLDLGTFDTSSTDYPDYTERLVNTSSPGIKNSRDSEK